MQTAVPDAMDLSTESDAVFELYGEQQERDREVDEQRVEPAAEGRGIAHASRSFTTWPCTSVSR